MALIIYSTLPPPPPRTQLSTALAVLMSQQLIVVSAERNLRKSNTNQQAVINAATDARSLRDRRRTKLSAPDAAADGAHAVDVELRSLRYSLDVHRVILRQRHPAYLSLTRRRFGWAALAVATVMLRRGSATQAAVCTQASHMLAKWTRAEAERVAASGGAGSAASSSSGTSAIAGEMRPALAAPTLNPRRGVPATMGLYDIAGMLPGGEVSGAGGLGVPDGSASDACTLSVAMVDTAGGGGGGNAPTPAASPAADRLALDARAARGVDGDDAGAVTGEDVAAAYDAVSRAWERMADADFVVAVTTGVGANGLPAALLAPSRYAEDAAAGAIRERRRSNASVPPTRPVGIVSGAVAQGVGAAVGPTTTAALRGPRGADAPAAAAQAASSAFTAGRRRLLAVVQSDDEDDEDGAEAAAASARAAADAPRSGSPDGGLLPVVWRFGHEAASRLQRDELVLAHVEATAPLAVRDDALRSVCALLELAEASTRGRRPLRSLASEPVRVDDIASELDRAAEPGSASAAAIASRLPLRPPPCVRAEFLEQLLEQPAGAQLRAAYAARDNAVAAAEALRAAATADENAGAGGSKKTVRAFAAATRAAATASATAKSIEQSLWTAEVSRRWMPQPGIGVRRIAKALHTLAAHPTAIVTLVDGAADDEDDEEDEDDVAGKSYAVEFRNVVLALQRAAIKTTLQVRRPTRNRMWQSMYLCALVISPVQTLR